MLDLVKAEQLAREGYTDAAIARALGISRHTILRRKKDSEAFEAALSAGREQAHSDVSNALWRQAKKGNVQAITWYEKTRRGMTDRIAQEISGPDGGPVAIREVVVKLPDPDATLES